MGYIRILEAIRISYSRVYNKDKVHSGTRLGSICKQGEVFSNTRGDSNLVQSCIQ